MERLKAVWARAQQTHLLRAWKRYGDTRGNVLAGGVGYFAFFSIFPALLLAFTVFGLVLQERPQLLAEVESYFIETFPAFVKTESNPDGIIAITAPTNQTLTVSGIVSLVLLLVAGLGWLGALRDAIRAVFRVEGRPGNFATQKLRDVGVMALFGVAIVVSAAVGAVAGAAAGWVSGLVGLGEQEWPLTVVSLLVGMALDGVIIALMLRVLAGVDIPWPVLRNAALFGGVALTLLKKFGTVLLQGTVGNPLFASFALVVGLLVWLNLMSRLVLISAAWAANDLVVATPVADLSAAQQRKLVEGPEPGPLTERQRVDAGLPTFGRRASDRTTLAAGAVLGATGAFALGGLLRGLRDVVRR
ncbi:MAG TPA: YihY/virulence factor BrkB family protein [Pedococcus sp.]